MKLSIASRLSALYAALMAATVVVVIFASAIALVFQLGRFGGDVILARHEQARMIAAQLTANGAPLKQVAPQIVAALGGTGLRVTVFDANGTYLAGDKSLHPHVLARWVRIRRAGPPPFERPLRGGSPPGTGGPQVRPGGGIPPFPESFGPVAAIDGGFVAVAPSQPLAWILLMPYWWIVVGIAAVAIAISWFVGRAFTHQAFRPLDDLTESLKALAEGDFTQRRLISYGADEIGTLTSAYNDAAAGVARAISERRETEERMRQFVADAGHELRTPLTVIGGYIDVLRRGAMTEPTIARQILGTMALEKEHMRSLIDRLMRLARLDAESPPRAETIDLAELLRSQCDAARRLDETREIDYSVDGVAEIVGDRAEIGEALWNVVENALKYAPEVPIHLRAVKTGGRTTISVRDEGPGMSESERLHAFERFYRGDQRGEIAGSGLGLAIAKRAVERAGGTIGIESAPSRGTTVTIEL